MCQFCAKPDWDLWEKDYSDYILQMGVLDGKVGLQISMLSAFYTFMKQARLWELHHAKSQTDLEPQLSQHMAELDAYLEQKKRAA